MPAAAKVSTMGKTNPREMWSKAFPAIHGGMVGTKLTTNPTTMAKLACTDPRICAGNSSLTYAYETQLDAGNPELLDNERY